MTESGGDSVTGIILLILGTWVVLIALLIVAWAIAHYMTTFSHIVYDLCSSSEGQFFYSVKIKTGRMPKEVLDGGKFVTLDLLGTSGQYVTRLVVPYEQSISNKVKAEQQESLTVTFKVGRKRRLPDIGRIRVDHELWHQNIFIHYVDIKSLNDEDGPRHFRANINKNVTMLPPAEVDVTKYQTEQVFKTEHDINYPGGQKAAVLPNLTLPEGAMFLVFAVVLVLALSYCLPAMLVKDKDFTDVTRAASNGAVAAVIAIVISLSLLIVFKFFLKRMRTVCGLSLTGRFALMTILLIITISLTIASAIIAYKNDVLVLDWFTALVIGGAILLLVGVPIGLMIEILSRRRAGGQVVREESTIQPQPGSSPGAHPLAP